MFLSSFFHQIFGLGEPSASQDNIAVDPLFTLLYSGATTICGAKIFQTCMLIYQTNSRAGITHH